MAGSWKWRTRFHLSSSPDAKPEFAIPTPDNLVISTSYENELNKYKIVNKTQTILPLQLSYLRKRTASPETSFFLFTNALQPVVSRCLRGCPAQTKFDKSLSICLVNEITSCVKILNKKCLFSTPVDVAKFPLHSM